jgi:hypothetical protein
LRFDFGDQLGDLIDVEFVVRSARAMRSSSESGASISELPCIFEQNATMPMHCPTIGGMIVAQIRTRRRCGIASRRSPRLQQIGFAASACASSSSARPV